MRLTSQAFSPAGIIPVRYTCDGDDISPPLVWSDTPSGTKSFALIMEDPDVPRQLRPDGLFVHWLLWNIPADQTTLAENEVPTGVVGQNSRGGQQYAGPCPPDREHRYFFRHYALDTMLELPPTTTKDELVQAMHGHILDQVELMGRYERPATQRPGFTFIELLTVIAIVALMTFVGIIYNNTSIKPKSRDVQRRDVAEQIVRALTLYHQDHGENVPLGSGASIDGANGLRRYCSDSASWTSSLGGQMKNYLPSFPVDPLNAVVRAGGKDRHYRYCYYYNAIANFDIGFDHTSFSQECLPWAGYAFFTATFETPPPTGFGSTTSVTCDSTTPMRSNASVTDVIVNALTSSGNPESRDWPQDKYYIRIWTLPK